jgi:hypothetical protein
VHILSHYDLIVTTKGDSIACKIDSIADPSIYFKMKHNNHWVHTNINRDNIIEHKYNAIDKKTVIFKPGTSYIEKVYSDNDKNLAKALKLNKTGKTLTRIGIGAIITGPLFVLVTGSGDVLGWTGLIIGAIVFYTGVGIEAVGITIRIISSKRIKRIG